MLGKAIRESIQELCRAAPRLRVLGDGHGWSEIIPEPVTRETCEAGMTAKDWIQRGYSLGQLGKNEQSYESYLRALRLDPTEFGIHTNIGSALSRLGRKEEALVYFRKETELHPQLALAWDTLARFCAALNPPTEALHASERAFGLAPDNIAIARNYALIALRAGAKPEHQRAVEAVRGLLDSTSARNNVPCS